MHGSLINLFGNVNNPDTEKVLRSLDMIQDVESQEGDFIIREGDQSTDFYMIGSGSVQVIKVIDETTDRQKILDTLHEGDFFGEGALFTDEPRSASVKAATDCRLFKINKQRFFEILKTNSEVATTFLSHILSVVNRRLQHSNKELIVLYEVSRLIAEEVKGLSPMANAILDQLMGLTGSPRSFFLVIDGLSSERLIGVKGYVQDVEAMELVSDYLDVKSQLADKNTHSVERDGSLFLATKKLDGSLNGLIVLESKDSESGFSHDEVRLCVSVAEQLGHVIENLIDKEDRKNEGRLNNEFMSF